MRVRTSLRMMILLLCMGGIYVLGICGYVLIQAWLFQRTASAAFKTPVPGILPAIVAAGSTVGRLEIDRLKVSLMVVEGTSGESLSLAAGHIEGTPMPGAEGNVGISAHRDTYFRPLRKIRNRDVVAFTTARGRFEYRVVSISIVPARDRAILAAGPSQTLTLVTCYPFYFVGPAPERYVVRAERVL